MLSLIIFRVIRISLSFENNPNIDIVLFKIINFKIIKKLKSLLIIDKINNKKFVFLKILIFSRMLINKKGERAPIFLLVGLKSR